MTRAHPDLRGVTRALVVRWDRIGDLVCVVPAIRALRQHCPQAHVTGLFSRINADLLAGTGLIDRAIVWPRRGPWRDTWRAARRLRACRFDLVLLLVTSDEGYPLARWLGATFRAGPVVRTRPLARASARLCLTHRFVFDQDARYRTGMPLIHETEKAIGAAEALGLPVTDRSVRIDLPDPVKAWCRTRVARRGEGPLIAVPLCRTYAARGWSAADVSALVDATHAAWPEATLLVTAGPEEARDGAWMEKNYGGRPGVVVVQQPGLQHWAGLMQMADVVISINSAAVHLAASGNVPSVVLCSADFQRWRGHEEWHPWHAAYRDVPMRRPGETIPAVLEAVASLLAPRLPARAVPGPAPGRDVGMTEATSQ